MAWIESHQSLKESHKVFELMATMKWSQPLAIGHLHLFWWWCVDHAEDGDLSRFKARHLAIAAGLGAEDGDAFLGAMVEAGFIDRTPYLRLHDWWDHFGTFLKSRYKSKPDRWNRIEQRYKIENDAIASLGRPLTPAEVGPVLVSGNTGATLEGGQAYPTPPVPNPTKQNQAKESRERSRSNQTVSNRFNKPILSELVAEFRLKEVARSDAEKLAHGFFDYYESNGWKVGKNQMKSWKHAVRNWLRNHNEWNEKESPANGGREVTLGDFL